MSNLVLGLDLGITSVGWALYNKNDPVFDLVDGGVRLFKEASADDNKTRREKRHMRRNKRRKNHRLERIRKLFINDHFFEDEQDLFEQIDMYYESNPNITPYHIRVKGLETELSRIELFIALYNIAKQRGVFYLDALTEEEKEQLQSDALPCNVQLQRYQQYMDFLNGKTNEIEKVRGEKNVFKNQMYVEEATRIFSHITYVDEPFQSKYFEIMTSKREYDDGPGDADSDSPYKLNIYDENGNVVNIFMDKLRGHCSYFSEEFCAPKQAYIAELFNLLNDLNNTQFDHEYLTREEKEKVVDYCKYKAGKSKKELKKSDIEKALGRKLTSIIGCRINKKDEPVFTCLTGFIQIREVFSKHGENIKTLDDLNLVDKVIEICSVYQHDEQRYEKLHKLFSSKNLNLEDALITDLSKVSFTGFHSLCEKIMNEVIDDMWNTNKNSMQLFKEYNYLGLLYKKYEQENLEPIKDVIMPSAVKRSYTQALRVIKAVTKKYGELDSVVIELARENNSDEARKYLTRLQKSNEEMNKKMETIIRTYQLDKKTNSKLFEKIRFYEMQNGKDIYTGKTIDLDRLIKEPEYCEVDHIIPRSVSFDDSLSNKVLTFKDINNIKGNQTPYQFFHSKDKDRLSRSYEAFKADVIKTYSGKKREYLLNEEDINKYSVQMKFIERNLVDTRYTTRQVMNHLKYYYKNKNIPTKVFNVNGAITSFVRKSIGLKKDRSQLRHHAEDAYIIAMVGATNLIQQLKDIHKDDGQDAVTGEIYDLDQFKKAELISELKAHIENMEFKFSHRVEKSITGQVFDETIYSTRNIEGQDWLINSIDLRDPKQSYGEYFSENGKNKDAVLMKQHDPQTYEYLCDIYTEYEKRAKEIAKCKNPFVAFEQETGQKIRKYSKKGNGPIIEKFKVRKEKLGLHKDISKKYKNLNSNKKVIIKNMQPFRVDMYYSETEKTKYKYVVVSRHMMNMTSQEGQKVMVINQEEYQRRMQDRGINESYHFIFSLYRRDILEIENNDKTVKGYFVGSMAVDKNIVELKPISYMQETGQRNYVTIGNKIIRVTKYVTDVLGNEYQSSEEKLQMIFPYKQVV